MESSHPSQKINFQLKNNKKATNSRPLIHGNEAESPFSEYNSVADAAAAETERRKVEGDALIIPLPKGSLSRFNILQRKSEHSIPKTSIECEHYQEEEEEEENYVRSDFSSHKKDEDWDIIEAISKEALGGAAKATKPTLASEVISISPSHEGNEKTIFRQDINHRADDVMVDSLAYIQVPISEFGAAMLRGMGWKDTLRDSNALPKDELMQPRHPRLGLGAVPKRLGDEGDVFHKNCKDTLNRKNCNELLHSKTGRKIDEENASYQNRLQIGSIVLVSVDDLDDTTSSINLKHQMRARVIQTNGVPGLNRVLLETEGSSSNIISVDKKKLTLLSAEDVVKKPFIVTEEDAEAKPILYDEPLNNIHGSHKGKKRYYNDALDSQHSFKHERKDIHSAEEYRSNKNRKNENNVVQRGSDEYKKTNNRQPWLLPHIRVRVISEKLHKGKMFKLKGIILDVLADGFEAVLQMDNGALLENVPERYLETAIPKVGGRVIILKGHSRLSLGKLLERSTNTNRGVVQLDTDLSVKNFPLDDIAEYCGSLY